MEYLEKHPCHDFIIEEVLMSLPPKKGRSFCARCGKTIKGSNNECQRETMNNKIDWEFISELEGNELNGYVPDAANSKSGVTIASGFDLGCRTYEELVDAFGMLGYSLSQYRGYKGLEAEEFLKDNPLCISQHEANLINEYSHNQAMRRLTLQWLDETNENFEELPAECQTVVASVAFQYGHLKSATPNFWKQVTSGQWLEAHANLRNFGDRYPTRRNKEANYLERWLFS